MKTVEVPTFQTLNIKIINMAKRRWHLITLADDSCMLWTYWSVQRWPFFPVKVAQWCRKPKNKHGSTIFLQASSHFLIFFFFGQWSMLTGVFLQHVWDSWWPSRLPLGSSWLSKCYRDQTDKIMIIKRDLQLLLFQWLCVGEKTLFGPVCVNDGSCNYTVWPLCQIGITARHCSRCICRIW